MKLAPETLAGTVLISALVAAGVWYSRDPEDQQWPLSYLSTGTGGGSTPVLVAVNHFDWSADGHKLLVRFRGGSSAETRLALHDLGQGTAPISIDVAGESVSTAALAPDGRHILLGTHEGHVWWVDPTSFEVAPSLFDLPHLSFITSAAITGDGRLVGAGTNSGSICLYDLAQKKFVILTTDQQGTVRDLRFSPNGLRMIDARSNGRIYLWDVATAEVVQEFAGNGESIQAAEFLQDGKCIITAGLDGTVRIWDIASGRELWRGDFELYGITTLAVSPDGTTAAWGGYHRKVVVWDLDRHRKKFEIVTSTPCILHLEFSPDGTALAASGQEETVRLYDLRTAAEKSGIQVVSPACL
jgi:WD40 repeat protein